MKDVIVCVCVDGGWWEERRGGGRVGGGDEFLLPVPWSKVLSIFYYKFYNFPLPINLNTPARKTTAIVQKFYCVCAKCSLFDLVV